MQGDIDIVVISQLARAVVLFGLWLFHKAVLMADSTRINSKM